MTYEERLQLFRTNVGFVLPNDVERKLNELGFFNAPASMKYHLSYEGGLFEHSMNVAMSLLDISCKLQLNWQRPNLMTQGRRVKEDDSLGLALVEWYLNSSLLHSP